MPQHAQVHHRLFGAHLTGVPILIFTGTALTPQTLELARRYNADVFTKPVAVLQGAVVMVAVGVLWTLRYSSARRWERT